MPEQEIATLDNKYIAAMSNYALLEKTMKDLKEQQVQIKSYIEQAMDEHNIKSIDNEYLKITRVAPTTRTSIDLKAFEKEEPEEYAALLEDYQKVTEVKASLRITVK